MQGVITGRDALRNLPLICSEFGFASAARVLAAVVWHRRTTFLEAVFDVHRGPACAARPSISPEPPCLRR